MTDKLDQPSREALVKYRMERAKDTMDEIEDLVEHQHFSTAINRLYYACFYAASTLLIKNGIEAGTHAGVKSRIGEHFVLTGRMTADEARCLTTLFNSRNAADYDDFIYSTEKEVQELIPKAQTFIAAVERILAEE